MNDSFKHWRNSPRNKDSMSFVISDSDEDEVVESSAKETVYVIESSDTSENVSRNLTPKKQSPIARSSLTESAIKRRIKKFIPRDDSETDEEEEILEDSNDSGGKYEDRSESFIVEDESDDEFSLDSPIKARRTKRKDITHDNTKENIKGMRIESSSEDEVRDNDSSNVNTEDEDKEVPAFKGGTEKIESRVSDQSNNSEPEVALSLARQEIGVGNIDPLVAQKRALLVCKMQQLQNELSRTKLLLTAGNINVLPDKGERLRESIAMQEKEIQKIAAELENTPLTQSIKSEQFSIKQEEVLFVKEEYPTQDNSYSYKVDTSDIDISNIPMKPTSSPTSKELGKKAQATFDKELALTVDRLQNLHGSLVARPSEDEKAEDPRGLKVKLMPHQQHALAWLLWREQQKPPGGVLADDMGLGKTLTMISLVMATLAKEDDSTSDNSDDEHMGARKPLRTKGGTLVVCPASLLSQWDSEIRNRCKRGSLSVEVYHGINRENVPKRLARNDVVITTYNILTREYKTMGTAFKINWKRVILDEAHIIRNHKSQAAEAVCGLTARKRWALTGTPIQNKEMDLYAILKFLKCSPFDDLRVWKRWVDNKCAAGGQRLATVMKALMLRRTKQELQAKGALETLPDKCIEEVFVKLDPQEQLVYEKVLIYSRTLFAQFLTQRAEKEHMADLGAGKYDRPSFLSNPNKNTQFTKAQNKLLSLHADVKTHEILVLLLRLRQICCHPSLINAMLDQEDMKESGIMDTENLDPDLLTQINNITLHENVDDPNEKEIGIDHRVTENLLTSKNPVFEPARISSKMRAVLSMVEEILQKGDKLVIVSQWTAMLDVVASHLSSIKDATYKMFSGSVPIKERQGIMDAFNARDSDPRVLLLSLTAGGVGLNLVGGNHLLLIDIHWNPQLETQAQDRIYRFGQTKNVFIYKFICKDTIEERIKQLQDKKLEIAQNVLTGSKDSTASKLTLNDLKSLFAL